jgi:prevent-host-death family protein
MSAGQAKAHFAEVVNRAAQGKERIMLTRGGKPLAAVIPVEDLEVIEAIEDAVDRDEIRKALKEVEAEGIIPWEEVKRSLGY